MINQSLKNKKILISAGASGIGWATTKICLSRGAIVFICDINKKYLTKTKKIKLILNLNSAEKSWKLGAPLLEVTTLSDMSWYGRPYINEAPGSTKFTNSGAVSAVIHARYGTCHIFKKHAYSRMGCAQRGRGHAS